MQDPIGAFERIRAFYVSYLDTAFRIGDESVAEERRLLLRRPGHSARHLSLSLFPGMNRLT